MNYLAHIFLSGEHTERLVGNFIGDFVKGQQWRNFPENVQKGILLHRFIDKYTDTHPIVLESIVKLRPVIGRFSGIVVDVFYDYFLAKNFQNYTPVSLPDFAQNSYQILEQHYEILPEKVQQLLPYMQKEDWLTHYGSAYGISKALQGLTRRLNHIIDLTQALPLLEDQKMAFEQDFLLFFPELQQAVLNFEY
jgi:acyl carrier protein phosphodiesterase